MKKCLLFSVGFLSICCLARGQKIRSTIAEIDSLITRDSSKVNNRLVTGSAYTELAKENIYSIAGTNLKDSKSMNSSATMDDKSITVNVSWRPFKKKMFLIQPNVAAISDKDFASIFSKGKYDHTLSGGITAQKYFHPRFIRYWQGDRKQLHTLMREKQYEYNNWECAQNQNSIQECINLTRPLFDSLHTYLDTIDKKEEIYDFSKIRIHYKQQLDSCITQLIAYAYLPAADSAKSYAELKKIIDASDQASIRKASENKYIDYQDSLQLGTPYSIPLFWLTLGIQYNNAPKPLIKNSSATKPSTFYNEYVDLKASSNILYLKSNGKKIYSAVNLTFSTIRNFRTKDLVTADFVSNINLNGTSAQKIDSSISYYPSIADRVYKYSVEFPFVYYWSRQHVGFDAAFYVGSNDPEEDNIGGHLGVFFPVSKVGENLLLIEPLLKFDNFFSSGNNNFIKDNFNFGFNISVSLPSYL